jgi:uncharacterized Zn finger protein (UPF0148 family)
MREYSVYEFACECGAPIVTLACEVECPQCGRIIRIEWQAPIEPAKSKQVRSS